MAGNRPTFRAARFASLALSLAALTSVQGASLNVLAGHILGEVRSSAGVVQMGASVSLYNRYDQQIRQVFTNETGKFVFDSLPPDLYSVRVSLASFVPALRRNIAVVAGSENLLKINLASVFSTVEIVPAASAAGTLMSDDWKWVLRASPSTRPILRILPGESGPSSSKVSAKVFSDTTGVVRVSAADDGDISQQGLGTAFAVSTRVNGRSDVRLSGKLGYTTGAGLPAGALRTTYSRSSGAGPQVSLTVRQIYLPTLVGSGTPTAGDSSPVLRTAAISVQDKVNLTEQFLLEYGASLESASYLTKVSAASPYARGTLRVGDKSVVRMAFSEGSQPVALVSEQHEIPSTDLNQDLAALALLPQLSLKNNRLAMELTQRYELGYETIQGSRKYSAAVFHEDVRNGAATVIGDETVFASGNLIGDWDSHNQILNIGSYRRSGSAIGLSQSLGDHMDVSVSAGYGGVLAAQSQVTRLDDASVANGLLHNTNKPWVTARVSGTIPHTGTKLATSYGWGDFNALTPQHLYLSSTVLQQQTGWNMSVHQPLPSFGNTWGRMEAGAEFRNMLSDGYLTILSGSKQSILTSSPRSIRGSLSFIF
jgi:hypothetical protein